MSRLTKKIRNNKYGIDLKTTEIKTMSDVSQFICELRIKLPPIYNKLGKLEDLAEKLGCPLEVLNSTKAMVLKDEEVYEVDIYYINFNDGIIAFGSSWSFTTRKTKDYNKTWWLKGEKEDE